jgi:hypothetical protein
MKLSEDTDLPHGDLSLPHIVIGNKACPAAGKQWLNNLVAASYFNV